MCWDAVVVCARLAGIIDEAKCRSLLYRPDILVTLKQTELRFPEAMLNMPAGHILGFFARRPPQRHLNPFSKQKDDEWVLIHAMISTGNGMAAGNKNDCMGIGHGVGWEELDVVTGLKWRVDGRVNAPAGGFSATSQLREVRIHHRPISDLRFL